MIRKPENGYFTEEQIDNHVKAVEKDVSEPLNKKRKRKDGKEVHIRKTANAGRIVYGENGVEGIKGRMSRTYTITSSDIGKIKTIYGTAKKIYVDDYYEKGVYIYFFFIVKNILIAYNRVEGK